MWALTTWLAYIASIHTSQMGSRYSHSHVIYEGSSSPSPDGMMESSLHPRDWCEMSHLPTKPCSPYLLSMGTASLKRGMTPLWKSSNSLGLLSAYLDWHTRLPRTLKGTLETVYSLINGPGERRAGEGEVLSATTSNVKVLEACRKHLDIFVTAIFSH